MAPNEVQSASVVAQHWKKFDLPRLQKELDETATELANRQDESEISRKKLVELSREFKRSTPEEIRRAVAPLLKSFQVEVDNLSQRSKAAEGAFLSIYKKLVECQDPLPFLETCHVALQKAARAQDLEIENKQLRETLNEYNEEFKEVRNQDVTIKQLRDKLREYGDKIDNTAKAKAHEIERELQKQFDEKERHLEETQVIITKKFEEAERRIGELQSALECTQTELFDLKAKYDEDSHAKSDEMEIVLNDLERANQRAAVAEKEVVSLKEQLAAVKQSLQLADQIQKAPDMEQAMDVLARSSLEIELAAKEKEISQLVDDIQRLQSTITTLKETSASQIAQLENMLSEKNRIIHKLEGKLEQQKDYLEIKQELQILKSMEFPDGERTTTPKTSPKPLEVLLLEKNKSLQSENTALKVAKAEVSESPPPGASTPPSAAQAGNGLPHPLQTVECFGTLLGEEIVSTYTKLMKKEDVSAPSTPKSVDSSSGAPDTPSAPSSTAITPVKQCVDDALDAPHVTATIVATLNMNNNNNNNNNNSTANNNNATVGPLVGPLVGPSVGSHGIQFSANNGSHSCPGLRDAMSASASGSSGIAHSYEAVISVEKLQEALRQNIDKYANDSLNTLSISRCVRELLSVHNIGQRLFAKFVLGLSQGTVSELLSKPKPWDKLTEKGRDSYRKMHAWASDESCICMLKALVPRKGKDASLPPLRQEDLATEERIAQILSEAQVAMTSPAKENKSPSSQNGNLYQMERKLFAPSSDNAAEDSRSEAGGGGGQDSDGGGGDKRALCHSTNSNSSSGVNSSSRRSRKYENDDIPQEMVARIYQEELTKLLGQHVEEGFRQRDGYERTQEEIRQALTIYHQELARLSQISPLANSDSFTRFAAAAAAASTFSHGALINGGYASLMASAGAGGGNSGRGRSVSPSDRHNVPLDATVQSRSRHAHEPPQRSSGGGGNSAAEEAMRHHGSAFSLVRPKVEPGTTGAPTSGSTTPVNTVAAKAGNYTQVSRSPTGTPGSILSVADVPDDLSASASPLQRMQSITNSLLSQTSLPVLPTPTSRPTKAVLPPITQHQFDLYNNLNTEDIVKRVKEQLSQYSISQRLFGESVLGLSQGSVSDLLARPKPWHMLTQKGREPFIRMKIFLEDDNAVHKLVASQYKIAPEKLMRTGGFAGVPTPIGSNNKLASRPPESVMVPYNKPPMELAHAVPPSSSSSSSSYGVPCEPPQMAQSPSPDSHHAAVAMALNNSVLNSCNPSAAAVAAANILGHSRRSHHHQHVSRSPAYVQPSVYEMAALTTDLDTQTITCKIKETLMAHNIGQKIFGEAVLGLSQGSVSELLSKPKPWHMLSIKGREPFIRMQLWLSDAHNVEKLQAIKNERREANKRRRSDYSDGCPSVPDNNFAFNFTPPSYPAAKKPRVLFSEEQKEALRLAFSMDPYPSTATIEFLATELNLSVRTITNWFHNHRMRLKQHISAGNEDIKLSSENMLCLTNSILPGVREGANFDPVQFRTLLRRRLTDLQAQKGAHNFSNNNNNNSNNSSPGIPSYGYSLYRGGCSPGQVDESGTLDLSMSSQNHRKSSIGGRYSLIKSELMNEDHSSDDMNEDSSFSQDPGNMSDGSDRDSVDDVSNPGGGSPRMTNRIPVPRGSHPDDKRPLNFSLGVLSGSGGLNISGSGGASVGSSNRRKPAMPQWVNPGLGMSPDSDVCSDDDLDDLDDDDDDDGHEIINGVCVRQTNDFDLRLHKEETVRVEPAPVSDQNARRRSGESPAGETRENRPKKNPSPYASVLPNGDLDSTNPRDLTKKPNVSSRSPIATNPTSVIPASLFGRPTPIERLSRDDDDDRSLNIKRLEKSVNEREDSWEDGETDEEKEDDAKEDSSTRDKDDTSLVRRISKTEKTDAWDF